MFVVVWSNHDPITNTTWKPILARYARRRIGRWNSKLSITTQVNLWRLWLQWDRHPQSHPTDSVFFVHRFRSNGDFSYFFFPLYKIIASHSYCVCMYIYRVLGVRSSTRWQKNRRLDSNVTKAVVIRILYILSTPNCRSIPVNIDVNICLFGQANGSWMTSCVIVFILMNDKNQGRSQRLLSTVVYLVFFNKGGGVIKKNVNMLWNEKLIEFIHYSYFFN